MYIFYLPLQLGCYIVSLPLGRNLPQELPKCLTIFVSERRLFLLGVRHFVFACSRPNNYPASLAIFWTSFSFSALQILRQFNENTLHFGRFLTACNSRHAGEYLLLALPTDTASSFGHTICQKWYSFSPNGKTLSYTIFSY